MNVRSVAFPFWGRVLLLAGILGLVLGGGLLTWRYIERPTVLKLAVGSIDGEAGKTASIIASHFATRKSPIRLDFETFGNAVDAGKAFSSG
jgi:hypothetical protein